MYIDEKVLFGGLLNKLTTLKIPIYFHRKLNTNNHLEKISTTKQMSIFYMHITESCLTV